MTKKKTNAKTSAKKKDIEKEELETEEAKQENSECTNEETTIDQEEPASCEEDIENLEVQIAELKDKHLRLFSEFDNFRKRTAKERIELFKTANADLMQDLLPVLDDFDRALKSFEDTEDTKSLKDGVSLISNKLMSTLEKKGLKCMDSQNQDFNTDFHEAITEIPAPSEELKSKVVDVVEKGYTLNDKVIRYAKVVVGK